MSAPQAVALFCESVREETGGTQTIVGVLPDNLSIERVPVALPKLSIYIRISVDPMAGDPGPLALRIVFPNGEEKELQDIDRQAILSAVADAKTKEAPLAGLLTFVTIPNFPVHHFGRVKVILRTQTGDTICGALNFQASSSTGPEQHASQSPTAASVITPSL
jgi:hypothetical protein